MDKKKMLTILEDTCSHYNLNNRSFSNEKTPLGNVFYATYLPSCNKTQGCAIYRLLPEWAKKELADLVKKDLDCNSLSIGKLLEKFSQTPNELAGLPELFLEAIQIMHDNDKYWTKSGLSADGESLKQLIISEFSLK